MVNQHALLLTTLPTYQSSLTPFKIIICQGSRSLHQLMCLGSANVNSCRRFGCCYSTRISCMLTHMVLSFYAKTESCIAYSLSFSHMLLTILKGALLFLWHVKIQWTVNRVLLCIKYLAKCPCPHCLVKKWQILALGTTVDNQWCANICKDDHWFGQWLPGSINGYLRRELD